jgi:flagellar biosynthesis chaperone FliJ
MTEQDQAIIRNVEPFLDHHEREAMKRAVRSYIESETAVERYRTMLERHVRAALRANEQNAARLRREYDEF